jgi:excisionase family DNA binding protein
MNGDLVNCCTTREAAKFFRVSPGKLVAWVRAGKIRALNLGTKQRPRFVFEPSAIKAFADAQAVLPAPKRRRRDDPAESGPY